MATVEATAAQVRDAHARAVRLLSDLRTEAHPRNLAGVTLVRRYHVDPVELWKRMDVSRTMGDQEILPAGLLDEDLLDESQEECERIIAVQVKKLKEIKAEREAALEERREGLARLSLGQAGDQPLPNAEIAKLTGLTLQQINADLKKTPRGTADLAHMLGITEARLIGTMERARDAGVAWPKPAQEEPLLFDPVDFRTWWDKNRLGWRPADQHALDMGLDRDRVHALLQVADEIGDLPEHDELDGERRFAPEPFAAWWANRERDRAEIAYGWAGATALAYEVRMPVLTLLGLFTAAKKARTLPEHRQGTRGRQYNVDAVRQFLQARSGAAGGESDGRFAPLGKLAEEIGEPEHVVTGWVREAEQRGIKLPPFEEGPRWRRYDREAFPAWWRETRERTRDGALASKEELAHLAGVPTRELTRSLAKAEQLGVVMPAAAEDGQYEVAWFLVWWPAWAAGVAAGPRFLPIAGLADELGLPREKVKRQVKAALERGRVLPPHTVNERGHRLFEVAGYRAWRQQIEA
ncbi:hypothetical protein [Nonomuraea sp. NPDC003214]